MVLLKVGSRACGFLLLTLKFPSRSFSLSFLFCSAFALAADRLLGTAFLWASALWASFPLTGSSLFIFLCISHLYHCSPQGHWKMLAIRLFLHPPHHVLASSVSVWKAFQAFLLFVPVRTPNKANLPERSLLVPNYLARKNLILREGPTRLGLMVICLQFPKGMSPSAALLLFALRTSSSRKCLKLGLRVCLRLIPLCFSLVRPFLMGLHALASLLWGCNGVFRCIGQ